MAAEPEHSSTGEDDSPPPLPPSVAVITPAYNEQDAVRATVEQVRRALEGASVAHEIVVVNDGSSDNTMAEARAGGARVIDFADNNGYGHALKADRKSTRLNSSHVALSRMP